MLFAYPMPIAAIQGFNGFHLLGISTNAFCANHMTHEAHFSASDFALLWIESEIVGCQGTKYAIKGTHM